MPQNEKALYTLDGVVFDAESYHRHLLLGGSTPMQPNPSASGLAGYGLELI